MRSAAIAAQRWTAALRNVQFDAARWVARQPGDYADREAAVGAGAAAADRAAVIADAPAQDVDALAFVRAHAARSRVPAQMTHGPMNRRTFLASSARRAGAAASLGVCAARSRCAARRRAPTTASCWCWSSSRAATTASTRSCRTPIPAYYALRPKLAIARDQVVQLSDRAGLHPVARAARCRCGRTSSSRCCRAWAIPTPNLSHFRSIEIWDTASKSDDVPAGRLAHARVRDATRARVVRRRRRDHRLERSRPARRRRHARHRARRTPSSSCAARSSRSRRGDARNKALAHILKVEGDIVQAASHLDGDARRSRPSFPTGGFGNAIQHRVPDHRQSRRASPSCASRCRASTRTRTSRRRRRGCSASSRSGLVALQLGAGRARQAGTTRWCSPTRSSAAGRRRTRTTAPTTAPPTSTSRWAAASRAASTAQRPISRARRPTATPRYALDFRSVYATVLDRWWGVDSRDALGGRFAPVPFLDLTARLRRRTRRAAAPCSSIRRCASSLLSSVAIAPTARSRTTARTPAATAARMRVAAERVLAALAARARATRCCGRSTIATASTGTTRRAAATASR